MRYNQLTEEERYHIYALLKSNYSQAAIAEALNRSRSTISRELSRNTGSRNYRPKQANEKAIERRRTARKYKRLTDELRVVITQKLEQKWSPEQITGFLKENGEAWLSHERIYQLISADKRDGGELYKHLRHSNKKRKKRYGGADRRGEIKNRVSIDERPKIVEKRSRVGDWELDTIIGKNHQGALVTIVDRCSLKTLIKKVSSKHAENINRACIEKLTPYSDISFTATSDNGKEFSGHEMLADKLGIAIYFAHPYCSWERGTNENTNGLIRQYIPKGSNLNDYDDDYIAFVEEQLNNRPRKCLVYQTPNQYFATMLA